MNDEEADTRPSQSALRRKIAKAIDNDSRCIEVMTDSLAGLDAWVGAVLDKALPLIREQIASEIEAATEGEDGGEVDGLRWAVRIARAAS